MDIDELKITIIEIVKKNAGNCGALDLEGDAIIFDASDIDNMAADIADELIERGIAK